METMQTLAQYLQKQPPTPTPPNSPIEPENQPPDLALPIQQPLLPPNPQHQNKLDFPTLVVAFCLTDVTEIAAQSLQYHTVHPLYLLCLTVVIAFASVFVAKYIAAKQPNAARVLNNVGVFFGVTAFFFAVTISFPLRLRIISWIIFGLSLLTILICNRP